MLSDSHCRSGGNETSIRLRSFNWVWRVQITVQSFQSFQGQLIWLSPPQLQIRVEIRRKTCTRSENLPSVEGAKQFLFLKKKYNSSCRFLVGNDSRPFKAVSLSLSAFLYLTHTQTPTHPDTHPPTHTHTHTHKNTACTDSHININNTEDAFFLNWNDLQVMSFWQIRTGFADLLNTRRTAI